MFVLMVTSLKVIIILLLISFLAFKWKRNVMKIRRTILRFRQQTNTMAFQKLSTVWVGTRSFPLVTNGETMFIKLRKLLKSRPIYKDRQILALPLTTICNVTLRILSCRSHQRRAIRDKSCYLQSINVLSVALVKLIALFVVPFPFCVSALRRSVKHFGRNKVVRI